MLLNPTEMLFLAIVCSFIGAAPVASKSDAFHIRHHSGRCLELRADQLVFGPFCRDHFKWDDGARLTHVPTGQCLVPLQNADGGHMSLTSNCSGTDTLFQYKRAWRSLKHLLTGKCMRPEKDGGSHENPSKAILSSHCQVENARFWFPAQVLYIIRQFSGLCWRRDSNEKSIQLSDSHVCDRFLLLSTNRLMNYATKRCLTLENHDLVLTSHCSTAKIFDMNINNNLLQEPSSRKCVQPKKGELFPGHGTSLVIDHCVDEDRQRFYFYDDKDSLDATLVSNSSAAHITINRYQYKFIERGIHIIVFDHRSGLFERIIKYDVYGYLAHRNTMANFLNQPPKNKVLFIVAKGRITLNTEASLALKRHGVSSTFASTPLSEVPCPLMATISYTGANRKPWEASMSMLECNAAVTITRVIQMFHDLKSCEDCSTEMGLRTGEVKDMQFSASSIWSSQYQAHDARLHKHDAGWCAQQNSTSNKLTVDLGSKRLLTGIAIQGHGGKTSKNMPLFTIRHSINGIAWKGLQNDTLFTGVLTSEQNETSVNWFDRMVARFIRVVPFALGIAPCIRMELFGCPYVGPFFNQSIYDGKGSGIKNQNNGNVSFHGIPLEYRDVLVHISNAASNTTLATDIDQQQFFSIDSAVTTNSGRVIYSSAKVTSLKSNVSGIATSLIVKATFKSPSRHNLDIIIGNKVLDAQKETGTSWNVYTFEVGKQILVICESFLIRRKVPDKSSLTFDITNASDKELENGDELQFEVSIGHLRWSNANAYNLQAFVYYDTNILKLASLKNNKDSHKVVSPTRNTTQAGVVGFQTDVLWLLRTHSVKFNFNVSIPARTSNGSSCEGAVIVDFVYMTNMAKFNGAASPFVSKQIPYECKVSKIGGLVSTSGVISGFSLVFDEVNNNLYICKERRKPSTSYLPVCFMQKNGGVFWQEITRFASIVGVDTRNRMLFGIDREGKKYVKLSYDLQSLTYIEEHEWTSIQDEPLVRRAKTASDVNSLPDNPDSSWVVPSPSQPMWAATRNGVMKYTDKRWKYAIWW